MYTLDGDDKVLELEGVPQSSVGAPLPLVVSDERMTIVAYFADDADTAWDGGTPRVVSPESTEPVVLIRFRGCTATLFGPPGDETLHGHPLSKRGLKHYGAFEVLNSSWVRSLERMNSAHTHHRPERFATLRHFVFTFHDSTFECVGRTIEVVEQFQGSMTDAAARMLALLR